MAEQQAAATGSAGAPAPTGQTGAPAAPAQATPSSGKGSATAPEQGKATATPAQQGAAGAAAATETPAWDADTAKWMQSKGWDATAFNPANEHHTKMIKSMRSSEAEATKMAQERRAREILEKAKPVVEKNKPGAEPVKVLSPLENYENDYAAEVHRAMRYNGIDPNDPNAARLLAQKNPDVYRELSESYVVARQEAWEKTQTWQREQEAKAQEQAKREAEFRDQIKAARDITEKTMAQLRQANPNLDAHLQASGAMDVLKILEDTQALPMEFLFVNPEIASFFAKAADAIAYKNDEPARFEKWKQDYETQKAGISAASGPVPAGAAAGMVSSAFVSPRSYGDKIDAAKIKK